MPDICLAQREARRFLLKKQGLLGDYRFQGKTGVLTFIRQAGCIQFDPVDVCGKNAEIVLQSRAGLYPLHAGGAAVYRPEAVGLL